VNIALMTASPDEPILFETLRDWPALYSPAVQGHVLDGPPTAALTLVPMQAIDLAQTQPLTPPVECEDCAAVGDEPCRTPSGKRKIGDHVSRIRTAAARKTATA
jgi:hypothetical protein